MLIVDDEKPARQGLSELVAGWGYETDTAADGLEALERVDSFSPLVVITDVVMPNMDGFKLLSRLREERPETAVILLTGQGSVDAAIRSVKEEGAFYYFEKPIDTRKLQLVLRKAADYSSTRRENALLRRQLREYGAFGDMVGASDAMREIYTLIEQVAPSAVSVLVTGESGTGKEMVARTIHRLSPRDNLPFIAINCAAVPETLMESELFGHEKGSFTGAADRRIGCFELANNGTLLLDEIAEMPFLLQAKLLRVLEDKKVRRLGSSKEMDVDVRVIAATNKDPLKAVQEGMLREDLLYRLNVVSIRLPSLKERKEDIPLLVDYFLSRKSKSQPKKISPQALELLTHYDWPGNVRELEHVIEGATVICQNDIIEPTDLWINAALSASSRSVGESAPTAAVSRDNGTAELISLEDLEKIHIEKVLRHNRWNRMKTAEMLGITSKTLYLKIKRYGLKSRGGEEE